MEKIEELGQSKCQKDVSGAFFWIFTMGTMHFHLLTLISLARALYFFHKNPCH